MVGFCAVCRRAIQRVIDLYADGTGAFSPPMGFPGCQNPGGLAAADLNADGNLDVVMVRVLSSSGSLAAALGDGALGFGPPSVYATGPYPGAVAVADFNEDGKPDAAVMSGVAVPPSGVVTVYPGDGQGGFGAPFPGAGVGLFTSNILVTGDVNSDGHVDAAVPFSSGVTVLLGNGAGTFPNGATVRQDLGALPGPAAGFRADGEPIRVTSPGCTAACGPEDTYRILAWETTGSIPRFNNAGSQLTHLVLENGATYPVSGNAWFWGGNGGLLGSQAFSLGPRATFVLNTTTVVAGAGGTITVSHDGRYGDLSGKAVSLEPATGFSFDTPLVHRPR